MSLLDGAQLQLYFIHLCQYRKKISRKRIGAFKNEGAALANK